MFVFLALTIQMEQCVRDKLTDYWSKLDQVYTPFYDTMMISDRYLHIVRYLHFTDDRKELVGQKKFDRLWKIRDLFEILNDIFSRFYNPSENLAIDEVIVTFKGRVIFKKYIRKNARVSAPKYIKFVTRFSTRMT